MNLLLALLIAFAVAVLTERMGWLRPKAAWAAALVGGLPLWAGGFSAALAVIFFVALGSVASRLNPKSHDHTGRRAFQVLANGLPAALGMALGSPVFFAAALATAAADTLATEIGSRSRWAWHPLKGRVESGTNAAVSAPGTLALVLGAGMFAPWAWWLDVPAGAVVFGGIAGALADTLLGLFEDRFEWWNNDLTNLLATTTGGLVALWLA
ncbi:DUF92 domain-containing protein [Meiothermus hypogaeus]|uniref:DUF92 domain-containing protein n=2 Tax=Meiothermus hypogaeus TaxID=884155 RepID=A0A511R526_9DEIN|nr:DUF92 domain-containing protein [Meiothermus hypogaeus]RIH75075.1 hypothetical protein Mhypo_03063 [Meiothermus hypogaeus]GEM84710.1 hypothetical protein MHY01S_28760 [Meiothermus hypogaeus NBRC 106114]GIW36756.1 MAG: hypothetical protein KatS3mg073_0901 [Meiothermus sp.]